MPGFQPYFVSRTLTWGVAPGCDEKTPLALLNGKKWASTTSKIGSNTSFAAVPNLITT